MHIVDRGTGVPLVIVPGIQGRWQYVRPTIDALAEHFRVISFSLCGEPDGPPFRPAGGIDNFADEIAAVLDERRIQRAVVCGISFGGLAALRFAASRPDRILALVLVSTPGPGWHLRPRHAFYARFPRVFGPLFLAESPWRLRAEIVSALPGRRRRMQFALQQLTTLATAPLSLTRIASRARLIGSVDVRPDCARVSAPTLVVTGEPELDHVVSADGTSAYADLIAGARAVRLPRTGHIGSVTVPGVLTHEIAGFLERCRGEHDAA